MTDKDSSFNFSLRHLQKHLPWTIPYSDEFENSASINSLRRVSHDVLHVMKSLGRIAAECEAADHARERRLTGEALAKEVADLVICALHIAKLEGFDLQEAVIKNSEARNATNIPPEAAYQAGQPVQVSEEAVTAIYPIILEALERVADGIIQDAGVVSGKIITAIQNKETTL